MPTSTLHEVRLIPDLAERQGTTIGGRSATMGRCNRAGSYVPSSCSVGIQDPASLAHEFGKASTTLNFHLFSVDELPIFMLVAAIRLPPQGFETYHPFAPTSSSLSPFLLDSDPPLCSNGCHDLLNPSFPLQRNDGRCRKHE